MEIVSEGRPAADKAMTKPEAFLFVLASVALLWLLINPRKPRH
jgi:hypothetical protein